MTAASLFPAWWPPPMTTSISPDAASRCRCLRRASLLIFFTFWASSRSLAASFCPDEGQAAGKPVIVISDTLWHSRFGGDPGIVDQTVALDGNPYNIIGVLPAGIQFPFLAPADIWSPRYFEHSLFTTQRLRQGVGYLTIIGRLRPGVSRERAVAEMNCSAPGNTTRKSWLPRMPILRSPWL